MKEHIAILAGFVLSVAVLGGCASTPASKDAVNAAPPQRTTYPMPDAFGVRRMKHGLSISLANEKACFFDHGEPVLCTYIASGMRAFDTPTGHFHVLSKQPMHRSTRYKNYFGEPAEMGWSMRIFGNIFVHEGFVPDGPPSARKVSHGCIHVPWQFAWDLYNLMHRGDTVLVTR